MPVIITYNSPRFKQMRKLKHREVTLFFRSKSHEIRFLTQVLDLTVTKATKLQGQVISSVFSVKLLHE